MLNFFTVKMYYKCRVVIVIFILLYQSAVAASEIAAVQSLDIKPYNDALKGFQSACNCDAKRFVVSEMEEIDTIKKINEANPDIIIAIGVDALNRVKRIKNKPIVYLMILNPETVILNGDNIAGISMNISPDKQLSVFQQALPGIKRIGLLYDPGKTGYFVKRSQSAATKLGIELIAMEIHSSKDVPALLKNMRGKIESFWMLPDVTLVTPETVELLLLFSFENNIPIITFSDKYVEMGALMSLSIDPDDIGKQAWEIVKEVLSKTDIKKFVKTDVRKIDITINQKTAKKLRITISNEILDKARVIK
jgi:putative ABC transport system substrate-binding protein